MKANKNDSRLDTKALLVHELIAGGHYICILSGDKRVQFIGNGKIKWYSPETDEYKTAEVHDYQLKPLNS